MKKLLIKLALLAVPIVAAAQAADMEPRNRHGVDMQFSMSDFSGFHPRYATRAEDRQGVTAVLRYEQLPDMKIPRIGHQTFAYQDDFFVVGGHTTGNQLTATAERCDGLASWKKYTTPNAHDGAFATKRYIKDVGTFTSNNNLIGGGFSQDNGVGQTTSTSYFFLYKYNKGPALSTPRAKCKGIYVGHRTYVSGNLNGDDSSFDLLDEEASAFQPVGQTSGRCSPYLFADNSGQVMTMSAYNNYGQSFGFYTNENGTEMMVADRYNPATDQTIRVGMPFSSADVPMLLPDDARSEDYHFKVNDKNYYLILSKTSNAYWMNLLRLDEGMLARYSDFIIPTKNPDTGMEITWRGSVIVNSDKLEVYLIGASGPVTNQTLHIISFSYDTGDWTIASAGGFRHNLLSASWTKLKDGRLACTGGGIYGDSDAQATAYVFTPPVAGQGYDNPDPQPGGPRLVVWLKTGEKVVYELAEAPKTTFSGTQLIISTNKVTVPYDRKSVLRYTYEDVTYNGIDLQPGERRVQVNREGDEVTFRGLQAGTVAYVYTAGGTLVEQTSVTDSLPLTITLKNRPNGVYIVKAGTETIKVMKK